MKNTLPYTVESISDADGPVDIRIIRDGKTWHLWGRYGKQKELDLISRIPKKSLPVFIGAGLGHGISTLLQQKRLVAVIDREHEISRITGSQRDLGENPNILWLNENSPQKLLEELFAWQTKNGGMPFAPVVLPLYPRLDREFYGTLIESLKSPAQYDFWTQAQYPKFQATSPRILFFDSQYFLCNEIQTSLQRLEIEHRALKINTTGLGEQAFIEELLKAVIDFKPDFVLTVNHFGLDRQGKLAALLEELHLPLASWFVDNPHLILHHYTHPGTDNTAIFTYDAGNLEPLRRKGFANTYYLPLATDPQRFSQKNFSYDVKSWQSDVSFVGNSMTQAVAKSLELSHLTEPWASTFPTIAADFEKSGTCDVATYLQTNASSWAALLEKQPTQESKLALESLLTWEATRQYRLKCVRKTLPHHPLVVGDTGWLSLFQDDKRWRYLPGIDYYEDLPRFYPQSTVNFNCTSRQMIGAVNQRVFDVPASGAFVLTDYRDQMESLFDLESEVVVYRDPDEIPSLIERSLKDHHTRKRIINAALKRIHAEHTYEIRLKKLCSHMRNTFLSQPARL